MKTIKTRLIGFTLLAMIPLFSGCRVLNSEKLVVLTEHGYNINPKTLLDDLSQGNLEAFEEFSPPVDFRNKQNDTIEWEESDYFVIVENVYQTENEDSIGEWQIYQLLFLADCNQVSSGPYFSYVKFVFQKFEEIRNSSKRYQYEISIIPLESQIYTRREEYFPNWASPKGIESEKHNITAKEALDIADLNGGMKIRELVDDQCTVFMLFFPDGLGYPGWQIHYRQSDVKQPAYAVFWIDSESRKIVRKEFLEGYEP